MPTAMLLNGVLTTGFLSWPILSLCLLIEAKHNLFVYGNSDPIL
jgi:hypothetical protein